MDRVCRFVGTSHPRYKTGDIIEIQVGGDNNRKFNHTDAQWEALKIARLDTLKQNALNLDYDGRKLTEAEIQVQWEDSAGAHHVDFDTQLETYNQSVMTYAYKRAAEYPDWKTQMDKIYHEGIDAWKADMVQPVKDRFPKT